MESAKPLGEIIANRRWVRHLDPFPHLVVPDVFVPEVADELDREVRRVVAGGDLNGLGTYDATASGLTAATPWPLRLFLTPAWRHFVAGVCGVSTIPFVSGSVHHHEPGSRTGEVHSDLSPIFFPAGEEHDGVTVIRNDLVDHKTGVAASDDVEIVEAVRAVSILYYTGNGPWQPGDGGETGLYRRLSDPPDRPTVAVPPRNNTLVVFECTPDSFHSFVTNTGAERNSVTMWLHRSRADAVGRWGEGSLVEWPAARALRLAAASA